MSKDSNSETDIVERLKDDAVSADEWGWPAKAQLSRDAADEITRLRAIVDKLPRTADGDIRLPGETAWVVVRGEVQGSKVADHAYFTNGRVCSYTDGPYRLNRRLSECYSTEAAALAASKKAGQQA